jgi:predicted ATPase/class 3 adenylate cyclase
VSVQTCRSCGQENADGFRFCGACGRPFGQERAASEERKVLTVLFCDLVGSTELAERRDPEDVRALLSAYYQRVRRELEHFGGTVEKFIGDAVMALFGAPVAHEDDPERAVRAALAIREWAQEEGRLEVRVGITTGEALVALGAQPAVGEGMASGDVVNTAARLQSAAPANGIVVDATTFRATQRSIAYTGPDEVAAKGKVAPVAVWQALEAKARVGVDVRLTPRTPLIGREQELEALGAALDRACREREPQLLTLVGVPGIGKSRLVWELFRRLERRPELIRWRQGRSLPYGEGVTYWALGEMVKAQAGVLETDDGPTTEGKLHELLTGLAADPADVQWLERNLRPLVGLEAAGDTGVDRRGEAFAAWRRFFETLAEQRPLVLVFEDLHFADDGLLDFVDHLAEWGSGVALLIVGTARPELLARRPAWGGGKPHALTLSLAPLSDEETERLVRALLERPLVGTAVHDVVVERAAGNPLYAEEFARMVEGHDPGNELPLPETVQGLIAARIDGLAPEEKEVLQAAAVVGKVFWLGVVAALAGVERWAVEERLHALERKQFVRRERRSSVAGETEYAFRHLLVRDVAYGQIPRPVRADKHREAAAWVTSLGRTEDHAETVAHHLVRALELLGASGRSTEEAARAACLALRDAGERAFALSSFAHAADLYGRALALWPPDDPARPGVLLRRAQALHLAADERQLEALEAARDALLEGGARDDAAEAEALLARARWYRGTWDGARSAFDRSLELLDDGSSTGAKARVLAAVAGFSMLEGETEQAMRTGREALAVADRLGLDEVRAAALATIGAARIELGDVGGIADLEESGRLAVAAGAALDAARACNNLAVTLYSEGELGRAFGLLEQALQHAERAGHADMLRFARGMMLLPSFDHGRWDECVRLADAFIAECEAGSPHTLQASIHCHRGAIRLARGELEAAVADADRALELGYQVQQPDRIFQSLAFAVRAYAAAGDVERAQHLASEFDLRTLGGRRTVPAWSYIHLAWSAAEIGVAEELARALEGLSRQTRWVAAAHAVVRGDFAAAAELFARMGTRPHEAYALLRGAGQLVAAGRRAEAEEPLASARALFRSTGSTRYLREADALVAGVV